MLIILGRVVRAALQVSDKWCPRPAPLLTDVHHFYIFCASGVVVLFSVDLGASPVLGHVLLTVVSRFFRMDKPLSLCLWA